MLRQQRGRVLVQIIIPLSRTKDGANRLLDNLFSRGWKKSGQLLRIPDENIGGPGLGLSV